MDGAVRRKVRSFRQVRLKSWRAPFDMLSSQSRGEGSRIRKRRAREGAVHTGAPHQFIGRHVPHA